MNASGKCILISFALEIFAIYIIFIKTIHAQKVGIMSKFSSLLFITLFVFGVYSISLGDDFLWESVGPEGGSVSDFAYRGSNLTGIYASLGGYPGSVYKSDDFGDTWTRIGVIEGPAYGIALDPSNTETVFVSSRNVIFKSTDDGLSWNSYQFIPTDTFVVKTAPRIDPVNTNNVYAAGYQSLSGTEFRIVFLKSTNGGINWEKSYIGGTYDCAGIFDLEIDPVDPQVIYVSGEYFDGGSSYIIAKTTDAGSSWIDITGSIRYSPSSIAVDPLNSDRVYIGTGIWVYWSTDGGMNWEHGSVMPFVSLVTIDPQNTNILYGASLGNAARSTDYGETWTIFPQVIDGDPSAIAANNSDNVLFGGTMGFYKSIDGGGTWNSSNIGLSASIVPDIAVAPSSPNVIYCYTSDCGLLKTTDGGTSWELLEGPELCSGYDGLSVETYNHQAIYLLGGP